MSTPDKDVAEKRQASTQNGLEIFLWLAGFFVYLTLKQIFEYTPLPTEISLVELGFLVAVPILCLRQFKAAKHAGQRTLDRLCEMSVALVIVLSVLSAAKWGVTWLANAYEGNWRMAARILNAEVVWLGCFLLAIYHPSNKAATAASDSESAAEAKP